MAIDSILTSCSPSKSSPPSKQKRRPSALSLSTTTSTLTTKILSPLKQTFSPIAQSFSPIKETFDEFVKAVTDLPSQIEDTYHEIIQTFNTYPSLSLAFLGFPVVAGGTANDSGLFSEKRPVPCLKVSMADFHEARCLRNGRGLVIKNDLDFDMLMVESSRRGSHDTVLSGNSHDMYLSRQSSISSRFLAALRYDTESNPEEETESDVDVMSLTSPGLSSPESSPKSSLSFETSTPEPSEAPQIRETPSRTSNETLVTERSDATKVGVEHSKEDDVDDVVDEMTPRKVVRMQVRHEVPRIWVLENPLPKMPVEIAPGILAV